jgi:hypothetical protein
LLTFPSNFHVLFLLVDITILAENSFQVPDLMYFVKLVINLPFHPNNLSRGLEESRPLCDPQVLLDIPPLSTYSPNVVAKAMY